MNLRLRWALALGALTLYWFLPTSIVWLWAGYLACFCLVFALRNFGSLLSTLFILSLLLIPAQLYQTTSIALLKIWFSPLVPLSFLFPDLNRSVSHSRSSNSQPRFKTLIGLSALSTFLGNGAFQILHAFSVILIGERWRMLYKSTLKSPALFIPLLWLVTGVLLRIGQNGDLKHLSTSASWLWAPLLCLIFERLNPAQLKHYLRFTLLGLLLSSCFGLGIYLINPSMESSLLRLLPFISSLHQGMLPGTTDTFAVGGFFFHRLKFAHLCLLLLPAVALAPGRWRALLCLVFIGTAIVFSHAVWAWVVLAALLLVYGIYLTRLGPPLTVISGVGVTFALLVHAGLMMKPELNAQMISKSPSLETRQFMAIQATELIVQNPLGLGHGGYKTWSLQHYPDELNNRQLPRTLPHNLGFSTLVETGVMGWTLIVALLAYLLSLSGKVLGQSVTSETTRLVALMLGSGTLALLGLGVLHDPLYHKPVAFGFMTLVALGHRLSRNHSI